MWFEGDKEYEVYLASHYNDRLSETISVTARNDTEAIDKFKEKLLEDCRYIVKEKT